MKKEIAVCAMVCRLLIAMPTSAANLPPGAPAYVPARLVEAIARQESGLNPWAVNVAGQDYQPAGRQEAERIIIEAERAGVSYDVGLMQINRWWIHRYDIPPAELLDPETNRKWGTWILAQELARHGFNWRAVGKYHSPDAERGRRYAWLVYRHYSFRPKSGFPVDKEVIHAKQEISNQNLPDAGRIQRHPSQRPQSRIVTFDLHQTGDAWIQRPKFGTPGSPVGTPALER